MKGTFRYTHLQKRQISNLGMLEYFWMGEVHYQQRKDHQLRKMVPQNQLAHLFLKLVSFKITCTKKSAQVAHKTYGQLVFKTFVNDQNAGKCRNKFNIEISTGLWINFSYYQNKYSQKRNILFAKEASGTLWNIGIHSAQTCFQ